MRTGDIKKPRTNKIYWNKTDLLLRTKVVNADEGFGPYTPTIHIIMFE